MLTLGMQREEAEQKDLLGGYLSNPKGMVVVRTVVVESQVVFY